MLSLAARRLLAASLKPSKPRRAPTALPIAPLAALEPLPNLDKLNIKSMGKKSHYAVVRGRVPGIYFSWDDCAAQVQGFKDNLYKGFTSESDASKYLEQHGIALETNPISIAAATAEPRPDRSLPAAKDEKRRQENNNNAFATLVSSDGGNNLENEEERGPLNGNEHANTTAAARNITNTATTTAIATTTLKTLVPPGSTARLQFDGASKRNPGPAALGAVLYDAETGFEVGTVKAYMGDHFTNNQAEYAGLIAGLQAAYEMGYDCIEVQGDSTLIVNQVLGLWKVKNEGLMPYHQMAVAMKKKFKKFRAKQVPRAENSVADALGNEAIREWNEGVGREVWTLERARAALEAEVAEDKGEDGGPLFKKQKLK